jgi:hypothetical protein
MKALYSCSAALAGMAIVLSSGLLAQPAKAANCSGAQLLANTCPANWDIVTSGGVQYKVTLPPSVLGSNPAFNPNILPTDNLSFTSLGGTNVNFQYNLNPTRSGNLNGSFTYQIQILTPGYSFALTQSNATGSDLSGGSFQTTLSENSNLFSPRVAGSASANPSPNAAISPNQTQLNVTQAYNNTDPASLSSVGANYTATPGPLPIVGTGIALGFSRKLRRRIRQAT